MVNYLSIVYKVHVTLESALCYRQKVLIQKAICIFLTVRTIFLKLSGE